MGEIVLAAKCTHVPTMLMSEQPGRLEGARKPAIDGHRGNRPPRQGTRCRYHRDLRHSLGDQRRFHINATVASRACSPPTNSRSSSRTCPMNTKAIRPWRRHRGSGLGQGRLYLSHQLDSLELEYGTLVPMRS